MTPRHLPAFRWIALSIVMTVSVWMLGASTASPIASGKATHGERGPVEPAGVVDPALRCCLPSGTCVTDPAACGVETAIPVSDCLHCIPPGDDCWEIPCGQSRISFCTDPLYPNFFDPGSEWFDEVVAVRTESQFGPVVIQRLEGAALDQPGDSAQIPIEILTFELVSCQPISIMTNGQPELWDLRATFLPFEDEEWLGLASEVRVSKDHPGGGRFDFTLYYLPLITFTRVAPPHDQRVVDNTTSGIPWPLESQPRGVPWVHQVTVPDSGACRAVGFVPGINGNPPAGCTSEAQCCEESAFTGYTFEGLRLVPQLFCTACDCGACCGADGGTCAVVTGNPPLGAPVVCLGLGGEFKGAGTTCADSDADGIPDVRETNGCCSSDWPIPGQDDLCNVPTDPRDPDTDFDGRSDGEELGSGMFSPCVHEDVMPAPPAVTSHPHGAMKQRYISVGMETWYSAEAFRVWDLDTGQSYYISTPRATPSSIAGQGLTFVVSDAVPPIHDWTNLQVIHIGGCMIAPGDNPDSSVGRAYEVRRTPDGVNFSLPLVAHTAPRPTLANGRFWGDVVGAFSTGGDGSTIPPTPANGWTPPNRSVSGFDITAALQGAAAGITAPHVTWTDVNPILTDRVTNGSDVLRVVNAFGVGSSREYYPFPYLRQPTSIHGPIPPSPALCPAPPLMSQLNP